MNDFKSYTTHVSKSFRSERFLWHRSFYDRRVRDFSEFESALAYVVRNPQAAGLADQESDWPWVASWLD